MNGVYPYKYTRKNRIRPKQTIIGTDEQGNPVYKKAHVNAKSYKLSLSQLNMIIINDLKVVKHIEPVVITRTDNYNCKQRRLIKRMEQRALREAA